MLLHGPTAAALVRCHLPMANRCYQRTFVTTSCCYGSKHKLTAKSAVKMVKNLDQEERELLKEAIRQREEHKIGITEAIEKPHLNDLYKLGIHQSLPFIGFGLLDNLIMIVAGEYIDASIGASLAISTMAAAALGNTLSDVFGVASAWYVEHWAAKLGVNPPNLTLEQLELPSSRIAANLGRALGVAFGCILGMFPLLFYAEDTEEEAKKEEAKN